MLKSASRVWEKYIGRSWGEPVAMYVNSRMHPASAHIRATSQCNGLAYTVSLEFSRKCQRISRKTKELRRKTKCFKRWLTNMEHPILYSPSPLPVAPEVTYLTQAAPDIGPMQKLRLMACGRSNPSAAPRTPIGVLDVGREVAAPPHSLCVDEVVRARVAWVL